MPRLATFAPVTAADIEELASLVVDSFDGYRTFAPRTWRPPPENHIAEALERWLADPGFWGERALDGQALIGHATYVPADRHSIRGQPESRLAHLSHLFLRPRYWGTGVAAELLAHATRAASKRGFAGMRLFVPVGQARARNFYAREGFSAVGEPFDPGLGLPVLEYRRTLS